MADKEEKEDKRKPFTKNAIKDGYHLAAALQEARQKAGYTQKDLAEEMGVSTSCIQKAEQNANKISAYVVFKYCSILHVSPEKILLAAQPDKRKSLIEEIDGYLAVMPDEMLESILTIAKQYSEKKK